MARLRAISVTGLHLLVLAAIGWFYLWTAVPESDRALISADGNGYYSLLTRGMAKGHLYLDRPADPFLATLRNPADPAERAGHGLHDASYYHGHYYLYFGVTPVVVLLLPFRLLTGRLLDESLACPLFCFAGFLVSVLLLRAVRRRHFPGAPDWAVLAGEMALGLVNLVPIMLRRVSVWEVPISCGYACCMLALYALFASGQRSHRAAWLALASTSLGLAVGSRPTYLFGSVALLVPLVQAARANGLGFGAWRDPAWRGLAWAAIGPLAAVGVALALYNLLRFGSPVDFGFRHLMNSDRMDTVRLFSWSFFWYNLRVYLVAPCGWTAFYPFVATASVPVPPPGHLGVEDPYGILPNIPFVLLALGTAGSMVRLGRKSVDRSDLGSFCASAWLVAVGTGLAVSAFGGAINRYMVDFAPSLIVLACIGLLRLASPGWGARGWRAGVMALSVLLLAYSAVFTILASARHNELFRADHPVLYRRVAHRWNQLSAMVDRWRGTRYGPIEMTVVFPVDKVGEVEPLLATGRSFLADYLFVHYTGPDSLRFGLSHTSRDGVLSEVIHAEPGVPHVLRIDLGSLYPPAGHPYFDRVSPAAARLQQTTVRVTFDGKLVLDRRMDLYDAVSARPDLGSVGDRPAFRRPFSGRIISWRRLAPLAPAAAVQGPLLIRAILPPFTGPHSEPLLSLGETGAGDLVYIRYESPTKISFGYDHWSMGGDHTPPLTVDPAQTQQIEIDSAALDPEPAAAMGTHAVRRGRLSIRLNGAAVLREEAPYYLSDPATLSVGLNAIQSSAAQSLFTGRLLGTERLPVSAPAAR